MIVIGALEVDVARVRATLSGAVVPMRPLDLRVLAHLARFYDRTQSRKAIAGALWGEDSAVDPRSIDACVARIRRALGDAGDAVVTVRRVGYRFDPSLLERLRGAS